MSASRSLRSDHCINHRLRAADNIMKRSFIRLYLGTAIGIFLWHVVVLVLRNVRSNELQTKRDQRQPIPNYNCKALMLHQGEHWEHGYASRNSTENDELRLSLLLSPSTQGAYFPQEIEWIVGKNNWRADLQGHCTCKWGKCTPLKDYRLMYIDMVGLKCGSCDVNGFPPSHSMWVPARDADEDAIIPPGGEGGVVLNRTVQPGPETLVRSPSLKLMQYLAESNYTLCTMGDSIHGQFYQALRRNLLRQQYLQSEINVSISEDSQSQ